MSGGGNLPASVSPILEISAEEPAAFQKKIRSRYPLYSKEEGGIIVPKELAGLLAALPFPKPMNLLTHKFLTEDSTRFISLTQEFVAISEQQYHRWEEFRQEIQDAQAALEEIYQPAFYSRIGLRYRDVINLSSLGLQDEPWDGLLKPAFLGILGAPEVQRHIPQIRTDSLIKLDEVPGGFLHLQHGLGMNVPATVDDYFIDVDFFTEDREATQNVSHILAIFNRLSGNFFRWASRQNFTKLLNQPPFNEAANLGALEQAVFYGTVNSPGHQLSFEMKGEGQNALKRWLGCVMLAMIPEDALNEALESLKDIVEFHTYTTHNMIPSSRTTRHTTGTIVSTSQRPDMVISE